VRGSYTRAVLELRSRGTRMAALSSPNCARSAAPIPGTANGRTGRSIQCVRMWRA